ncbi:p115 like vesicle tethering protein [Zychaea mexicana]|uniref:p115 like vesicle tethering protein n=1 Tax=Zychaea mexicana TaxID=64656 RepID=UPI0022FF3E7F|nr:p115 like vesicle tethering protein [Zychaea mexicana]KAI9469343.1 p115 like vesicle tethering protein [Zychaea mexicana]
MDFLTRGYIAIRGDKGQPQSVDETIEKLADCLETATLLEDRRAAVLSLKGLVRDYPENVGAQAFPGLIKVLHNDYKDGDMTKSILETLTVLCSVERENVAEDKGYKYTDLFLKDSSNVSIVLDVLEEFDFYLRYSAIKLLSTLSYNRNTGIQQCVLTSPMGITRLADLLNDKRDIIRNESLLLLTSLTQNNAEIQKLVTFQATFEKLLTVIEDEEGISGGIVVQDSLILMHNLLKYNVSNQIYFRETSCIQQIPGLLGYVGDSEADHVPYSYEDWPPQKVANTVLVLDLCRILTEPEGVNTATNQKAMVQSSILLPIVQLGICSNAPAFVRTGAIYSIAYVVYNNPAVQELFAKTVVATPPRLIDGEIDPAAPPGLPRPAMVSLIAIAAAADPDVEYSYTSRAAAAFAVASCLQGNEEAQLVLASMLKMPPDDNVNSQYTDKPFSAGSLLLEAVQNWELSAADPYKVWFSCTILSHVIMGNEQAKKIAGSIVFGDEANGEEPVPLLHHIMAQLLMAAKNPGTNCRIPIGYLCLLCTWLYDSPESVSLFLSESTHIQFLIQEIQSSANDPVVQGLAAFLLGITYENNNDPNTPLSSRIDLFTSLLSRLRDSPAVKNAPQYLEISPEDESISLSTGSLPSLLLDNAFAEFFKDTYEQTTRALKRKPSSFNKSPSGEAASPLMGANVISEQQLESYKETISQQANEITQLKQQVSELDSCKTTISNLQNQVAELEGRLKAMRTDESALQDKMSELERGRAAMQESLTSMEKEQEDLLVCMGEQDLDIKKYRKRLRDKGEPVTDSEDEEE